MITIEIKENNTWIDRTAFIDWTSFQMSSVLSSSPNSIDFMVKNYGSKQYEVVNGNEIRVKEDGTTIFGGYIVEIEKTGQALAKYQKVKCKDYTQILDRLLVSKTYTNMTGGAIISDLIATYGGGNFTTSGVVCSVVVQKIVFNYLTISQCLSKLADMLGQYAWDISPTKDILFFDTSIQDAPYQIDDIGGNFDYSSLMIKKSNTQLRNKITIRGGVVDGDTFTDLKLADGVQKSFFVGYTLNNISAQLQSFNGTPYAKYSFDNVLTNSGSSTSSSLSANNGTPTFVADSSGVSNFARQYTSGARDSGSLQAGITGSWFLEWQGKRNASGTGTNWALVETGTYSGNTGFGIWVDNTDNQINIRVNQIWGGSNSIMKTGFIMPLNTACKLRATYDGANIKFYKQVIGTDASLVLVKTIPFTTNPNSSTAIFVGARGDTTTEYQTNICDYFVIHNSDRLPSAWNTLTIGIDGKDKETNFDVLYNKDDGFIKFKDSNIPEKDSVLQYSGNPTLPLLTQKSDLVSINKYGVYEYVIVDKSIKSKESASQRASAELIQYSRPQATISFTTTKSGLQTGDRILVNSPSYNILNEYYKVHTISAVMKTPTSFKYKVDLTMADNMDLVQLLKKILLDSQSDKVDVSDNEVVDRLYSVNEELQVAEVWKFDKVGKAVLESVSFAENFLAHKNATQFVIGDYIPTSLSDTKRVFVLDGSVLG